MTQSENKDTVLVIDDQASTLAMLFEYLREQDVTVVVSENGESGLKRADYVLPDLILLDVMMPGIDGFETCRQLKMNERSRSIPVIFMTALHAMEDKVKGFEAGGVDYVTKPLQLDEVWARIRTHLRMSALQHELQEKNRALKREIEERRLAERALKESEERYRTIFETVPDSLFIADFEGHIVEANPSACRQYQYDREEFLALDAAQLISPESRSQLTRLRQSLRASGRFLGETVELRKDGTRWDTEVHGAVIQFHERPHMLAIIRDITERKNAEREIHALNATLGERVRQRTAELNASNKSLQDFIYAASHDLRTPLIGISHIADWLMRDYVESFDRAGKEMMELLAARVKRMDRLIDAILAYTKIGRMSESTHEIDLNDLLLSVLEALKPPDSIQIVIERELPRIVGHAAYLEQIFHQLLKNAVAYTDKIEGRIHVGCLETEESRTFYVKDNGPGIAPQYHGKIFQMFQSLSPRDEAESIGVGLAIVKKIVEFYGGRIWLESDPGQGASFFFTLQQHVL